MEEVHSTKRIESVSTSSIYIFVEQRIFDEKDRREKTWTGLCMFSHNKHKKFVCTKGVRLGLEMYCKTIFEYIRYRSN